MRTDTKKLVVPSARSKNPGKSFSHVSSPYMTNLLPRFAFICASQVSCVARVELVSDSAKLRTTSRKLGTDPVVIALTLGMVIVGGLAWPVKGNAPPNLIKLQQTVNGLTHQYGCSGLPLGEAEIRLRAVYKVANGRQRGPGRLSQKKYLRSASTTMKMTLSKGEERGDTSRPEGHAANPGRKALWGKNPDAKTRIPQMVKTLDRKHQDFWTVMYIVMSSKTSAPALRI